MTTILILILILVAVNMAATFWAHYRTLEWLDSIGAMVGEHIDKETER
uniref:Uncharacterized protein n=1 Tax=viral metagenome TaxID=1070528 RepID=A0A6M3IGV1_9ZZZZ